MIFGVPVIWACVLHAFKRAVRVYSLPYLQVICKDKEDPEKHAKNVEAAGTILYKGIFYTTSTVFGFLIMRGTDILPGTLGG